MLRAPGVPWREMYLTEWLLALARRSLQADRQWALPPWYRLVPSQRKEKLAFPQRLQWFWLPDWLLLQEYRHELRPRLLHELLPLQKCQHRRG